MTISSTVEYEDKIHLDFPINLIYNRIIECIIKIYHKYSIFLLIFYLSILYINN